MERKPSFFKNLLLLRRFIRLKKDADSLATVPDSLSQKALEQENAVIDEQIDKRLSITSAEVLKKYHSGARIQPISHYSIKDINKMSEQRISYINGIGPKSAYAIKKCVNQYVSEVSENERLRLSEDQHSDNQAKLVKTLYQIDKQSEIAEQAKFIRDTNLGDKDLIKKARQASHPLLWIFTKDKESAMGSIDEIQQLLNSPIVTEIEALKGKRSEILKAKHDAYWGTFASDSAKYYSILEECEDKQKGKKRRKKNDRYLEVFSPELKQQIERVEIKTDGLKCILRPYQKFGVRYILNQGNVLLGDEMGLGKTIEAIATMVSLKNSGETHFVVICPASVLINWKREIDKHSDLKTYVLHGVDFKDNLEAWSANEGVAITNFENTSRFRFDSTIALTVVDEAHYIKNSNAARTRNSVNILNMSKRRLLMSGTPIENKLDEMVALINMLQPNLVKNIYALPQPINQYSFRKTVAPVYLRRTKDAVWKEMPDLQVVEDVTALSPAEKQLYIECVHQRNMSAFSIMRQISFEVENQKDSTKLNRIKEICDEAFSNGRKVIIFSFYINTIKKIQDNIGIPVFGPITGALSPQNRQNIIDAFSDVEGGAVLLSQIIAGGTGLNIQKASIVIFCEPQYKPSIENQAIARAYRIGQTSNVTAYRLIGEKTIDERILQLLKEKQAVFDAYANKSESGEQSLQLKESELAELEFANCNIS